MQFRHPYAFECIADSPGCRTVASTSQLPDAPRLGCPCLSCPACNTHLRTSWADTRYGARRRATRRSPCQSVGSRVCPLPNADSNVANDDFPEIATALRSRASWRSTAHSMSLRGWRPVDSVDFGGDQRLEPRGGRQSAKRHASGWSGSIPWNESATNLVRCALLPKGFPAELQSPAGLGSTGTALGPVRRSHAVPRWCLVAWHRRGWIEWPIDFVHTPSRTLPGDGFGFRRTMSRASIRRVGSPGNAWAGVRDQRKGEATRDGYGVFTPVEGGDRDAMMRSCDVGAIVERASPAPIERAARRRAAQGTDCADDVGIV
jgi:hypothetical protein